MPIGESALRVITQSQDNSGVGRIFSNDKHWLLINIEPLKREERLLFKPTSLLHEKQIIQVKSGGKELENHDPARITNIDCPTSLTYRKLANGNYISTELESGSDKNELLCYLVDSLMPRNLILRERALTADADLKPEFAASLQAEDGDAKTTVLNQISGLNLKDRNLDYADFSYSSLPNADLRRASLKHANFINSRLDKPKLQYSLLNDADLNGAKLPGAKLIDARLPGANLSGAKLLGASLIGAYLPGATLISA